MPEIEQLLCLVEDILGKFGFSQFEVNLSTRPEESIGSDEVWATAEGALRDALNSKAWEFTVDEGGGAFYGPKIDIKIQVLHPYLHLWSSRPNHYSYHSCWKTLPVNLASNQRARLNKALSTHSF